MNAISLKSRIDAELRKVSMPEMLFCVTASGDRWVGAGRFKR